MAVWIKCSSVFSLIFEAIPGAVSTGLGVDRALLVLKRTRMAILISFPSLIPLSLL